MKVKAHTGTIHNAEVVDTRYFDNVLITGCGRQLYQRVFGNPMGNIATKTHQAVTCKVCKRRKA